MNDLEILQKAYALIQDAYCMDDGWHDPYIEHICKDFKCLIERMAKEKEEAEKR